ncbi:MAG: TetR/AcrR family transcriptional regulator [Actinobacteria bacterium]|nr:TetR/AcrR family transcriptional regulator [Actinomycetota bacterium]
MSQVEDHGLQLRARPSQARSVATFNLILDTTGLLLDAGGFDAVTTNLIAEEAGITVRAIYRYFPNKHAIVVELARRMASQWSDAVGTLGSLAEPAEPWRDLWCSYVDTFLAAVRQTPGGPAVLLAMRSDPILRRVDDDANREYVNQIADAIRARSSRVDAREARRVATVLMASTVAIVDEALMNGSAESPKLIELMTTMQLGFLERYLDDPR